MTNRDLPRYIQRGGEQCLQQPFMHNDVTVYAFPIEGDRRAIEATCDKYLNGKTQSGIRYVPLASLVFLIAARIERAHCQNPPDNRIGWMPEIDVGFWVPVVGVKKHLGVWVAERIAWFLPYVFVDNPWAYASGREVYGFPKEMGKFQMPASPADARLVTVDAMAVRKFDPNTEATVQRIFDVRRRGDAPPSPVSEAWADLKSAFTALLELFLGADGRVTLPGLGIGVELLDLMKHEEVPFVFLKQFRDLADPAAACYQAVVESRARITEFRTGGFLPGDYDVTVQELETHPIAAELGLASPKLAAIRPWYVQFDFLMEDGQEV